MSSILHNVVIHPPASLNVGEDLFRVVSRTDGKTRVQRQPEREDVPSRSGPRRCPLCGTSISDNPELFRMIGDTYECTVCRSRINARGTLITIGVENV